MGGEEGSSETIRGAQTVSSTQTQREDIDEEEISELGTDCHPFFLF